MDFITGIYLLGRIHAIEQFKILHRIVKEKPPEHPRSTAKFTHVVTDYGLTCGQTQKTGLFQPQFGKEQAHRICRENASFHELLRENKRKIGNPTIPDSWSE